MRQHSIWLAGMAVVASVVMAGPTAKAEWYVAAQGGVQVPQDLSSIRGIGSNSGVTSNDLNLRNQIAYGVKVGYFFKDSWNWLGVEFDFYHSDVNIERQGTTASGQILGTTQQGGQTPRVGLTSNNMVINFIARYPGGQFQPYVGVGGGLGESLLRTSPERETTHYPVFNVLVGVKMFVTEHVALFTEYKHNRASLEFSRNQFEADLRTNWFMGGIAYHF